MECLNHLVNLTTSAESVGLGKTRPFLWSEHNLSPDFRSDFLARAPNEYSSSLAIARRAGDSGRVFLRFSSILVDSDFKLG